MTDSPSYGALPDKPHFSCEIPLRWGDMDALGHVNNTLYLRYCEEARFQWLTEAGIQLRPDSYPVVVQVGCTFLMPLVYPDNLRIDCYAADPGRSSFMAYFRIYSDKRPDAPAAEAHSKVVWLGADGKSQPLPEPIKAWFQGPSD